MKNKIQYISFILLIFTMLCVGCKSEFEKIRLSSDPQKILDGSLKYFEEGDYLKTQTLLELILNQYRGTKEAEQLFFNYAYTHYHLRQYQLASHYFDNFSNTFAYSDKREEADYMGAYSNFKLSPVFRLDQKPTEDAIEGFQEFVNKYPNSTRVSEANTLIDNMRKKLELKSVEQGELYYDLERYQAAIASYETTLQKFPETDEAEYIRFKILKSAFEYAVNSIFERRGERYEETLEIYQEFIKKYPNSQYLNDAKSYAASAEKELKLIGYGGY